MDVREKKVTVVGLGDTALALVWLLKCEGAHPFVTEAANGPKVECFARELDEWGVAHEIGGHTDAAIQDTSLIIPSPGVPLDIPLIQQACTRGVPLIGEMELAFSRCQSQIVAVTGTNGKTTTTELLCALIESCGHSVLLAGNNMCPFSVAVLVYPPPDFVVLEVSSYQLETTKTFRPWAGVVLNVSPDHLARHGTVEAYTAVKARMFANQQTGDIAVINHDDPRVRGMAAHSRARIRPFSLEGPLDSGMWTDGDRIYSGDRPVARRTDSPLRGRHNLENVLAALSVMEAGGFDWEKTLEGLRAFHGVEHRIEHVADVDGVAFYNDSKSTNIDSLRAALESFDTPVVLIAGGQGKGAGYETLRDVVLRGVRALITLGEDAPRLEEALGDLVAAERVDDMADAVTRAAAAAVPGDTVLLSPACASFDMYTDFEHRGRVFKECVETYAAARRCAKESGV